ncbi:hypothetical protein OS493_036090 [Desmophyllum pertusum]|uniref:Uncharacterized protein n=1 Tax=Desmophyllum pertusum TaxID=174260 RepID=A0A9W9YLI5_9CNID|nr:hypothetical protein OS493_036090 [Desmophyllum pertusum]
MGRGNPSRTYSKVKSGSVPKKKVLDARPRVPPSQDPFAHLSLPLSSSHSFTSTAQYVTTDPAGVPCVTAPRHHYAPDLSKAWVTAVKARLITGAFQSRETGQKE